MTDAPSHRVREHYPGEPTPASMVRDLQRAIFGASYASSKSPAEEWAYLLDIVQSSTPSLPWGDGR